MGNQQSAALQNTLQRRSRYRTLNQPPKDNRSKINSSRRNEDSFDNDISIFKTPPINRSINTYKQSQVGDQKAEQQPNENENDKEVRRRYSSIDASELRNGQPRSSKEQRSEKDRVLESLGRKNEELRRQLKKISDELTEKLKYKKLVPKKKGKDHGNDEQQQEIKVDKQQIGLKKELENAYKQIEMYKKLIIELRNKQQGTTADHRVSVLESEIEMKNKEIEKYQQKKIAIQKIKSKQSNHIKIQISEELQNGIDTYKKQAHQLQEKLKKIAKQDRARQQVYKKQQAYLCDLERKLRQLEGSYFPELGNKIKKEQIKTATSDTHLIGVSNREFNQLAEQARMLRKKHEQYNKKIEAILQAKNRSIEEQNDLKDQVVYKQRIIEVLKNKISRINVLLKPRKANLFGYNSQSQSQQGSQAQSQFNDNQSQIERQLQQQLNQDIFDIKHLIANIPKPIRKKPQQMTNGYSSGDSSGGIKRNRDGSGMIVTNEKAEPKKWQTNLMRTIQRGKHFKGQLSFEDKVQFQGQVQPLIVGVNIWVNKNNTVLGIQAVYLNKNELRYGFKSSESAEGYIKRFDLQTPDYLKNITLTVGAEGFIQSITLHSQQGKSSTFGNKRSMDTYLNFGLSSNQRPYMFFGASSLYQSQPRLNSFGIQVCCQ